MGAPPSRYAPDRCSISSATARWSRRCWSAPRTACSRCSSPRPRGCPSPLRSTRTGTSRSCPTSAAATTRPIASGTRPSSPGSRGRSPRPRRASTSRPACRAARANGVEIASVTLHVGLGTFQPVTADDLDQHPMHAEVYSIPDATAGVIAAARDRGAPVIAIGTTVVRARWRRPPIRPAQASCGRSRGQTRPSYPAGLPVPRRRRPADQLPPAALDAARAGVRLRRPRAHARSRTARRSTPATASTRYGDAMLIRGGGARHEPGRLVSPSPSWRRDGHARTGVLVHAARRRLTPTFMPVGTQGSVKTLTPGRGGRDRREDRPRQHVSPVAPPWPELVAQLGGLHAFTRWPHAMLTDSGGFQAFSLAERRTLVEDGFVFRSHPRRRPQDAHARGRDGGAGAARGRHRDAARRVPAGRRAARRGRGGVPPDDALGEALPRREAPEQALFGIVQGGTRSRCGRRTPMSSARCRSTGSPWAASPWASRSR